MSGSRSRSKILDQRSAIHHQPGSSCCIKVPGRPTWETILELRTSQCRKTTLSPHPPGSSCCPSVYLLYLDTCPHPMSLSPSQVPSVFLFIQDHILYQAPATLSPLYHHQKQFTHSFYSLFFILTLRLRLTKYFNSSFFHSVFIKYPLFHSIRNGRSAKI